MNTVTIFLPVSRATYLQQVFTALELLDCDREKTNLLVLVDGDATLFIDARNRTELSKFASRLCVQWKSKHTLRHYDIAGRRMRIADIHNDAKQYIGECEFIFGVEDDTIIQSNSLKKLLADFGRYPYAGFIQGVQLGRWGIPHVGAWLFDDIYEPTKITSATPNKGVLPIDAGGFYCYLTRKVDFVKHDYKPFDGNSLGPDVDFGIELRRAGIQNYIDWSIETIHKSKDKDITPMNTEVRNVTFMKNAHGRWRQRNHTS